ncbi:MAG: hypothetical protein WBN12_08955, partial [Lutimonas sp.]
MKRFLVLLFLLSGVLAMAQSRPQGAKVKDLIIRNDTIQIDSLSINPGYLEVYDQSGVIIERERYQVDYTKAKLWFIHKEDVLGKKIQIVYLPYPDFMTRNYSAFDRSLIVSEATDESQLYSSQAN